MSDTEVKRDNQMQINDECDTEGGKVEESEIDRSNENFAADFEANNQKGDAVMKIPIGKIKFSFDFLQIRTISGTNLI